MSKNIYPYIIIGAGLAGVSAIEGIRDMDRDKVIALFGDEKDLPYDRPPLSKKLWFGKMPPEKIFLHPQEFYDTNKVALHLGVTVSSIDPERKMITDDSGRTYGYERLLLATGGNPRRLTLPGADLEGICYYRYLDDYRHIRAEAQDGKRAVIIGGGFIGSEIAAALTLNNVKVSMVFPDPYLCARVFPEYLARAVGSMFAARGIEIIKDAPTAFFKKDGKFTTRTQNARDIESNMIIAGIGISPEAGLAQTAKLKFDNGVVVNEYLATSDPAIYAAGDIARFPCKALGKDMRMEHWDNALRQGRHAGRNMAGAREPFEYLPYFFSDLFEFGYEAVGEVDAGLETFADWQEENRKGVIYYLSSKTVRGVMLCNVWGKVDVARELIATGKPVIINSLRGVIQ